VLTLRTNRAANHGERFEDAALVVAIHRKVCVMPKRRLSRAKHNVMRRLDRRLSRLCFEAQQQVYAALDEAQNDGKTYEEVVTPTGRALYSDSEVNDIKRKLKALGAKGINV
jgi:hypothetical protein